MKSFTSVIFENNTYLLRFSRNLKVNIAGISGLGKGSEFTFLLLIKFRKSRNGIKRRRQMLTKTNAASKESNSLT